MPDDDAPLRSGTASQADLLDEIVAGYLRAIESGETPSQEELLARHPTLSDELREFFADHDRLASIARPLFEATISQTAGGTLPERIRYFGDYELLEEIARGGMGVVYKARQVRLNRIVAIKMILSGQLASPADVERFHTEAEAAAKLDHPGIVPIHEVGEHEGQHYFSMGFVDGQSLSTRAAQGPLPAREAAELVRAVAEAVQYAHDNGVVHRDLKPGNVLLDRHGKPRITDFGLAKLTESHSDLTGTGQVLGTPGYMPPEQAAAHVGAVGPLSDIYSLGAILYCLLTGRPPFQAATPIETLLQVQKQEPVPPRQLNPAIPLDLDTIVLKCLEKSPARRYSTARLVADELQRFLDGRPIVARPVGSAERTWRWCRRNPVVASLATLLIAMLLTSVVILGISNVWIAQERDKKNEALQQKGLALLAAEKSKEVAKTKENSAQENLLKALQAVDRMLVRVADERLVNIPQMEHVRKALLEDAHEFYEEFLEHQTDDPRLRFEVAVSYSRIGDIRRLLGEPDRAAEAIQQSIDFLNRLTSDFPAEIKYRRKLAVCYQQLGFTFAYHTRPQEGEKAYEKALSLFSALADEADRHSIAEIHEGLATAMSGVGRNPEALSECRKGLAIAEGLAADFPENPQYLHRLAHNSYILGVVLERSRMFAESELPLRRALNLRSKQFKDAPDQLSSRHMLAMSQIELGRVLRAMGRKSEAEELAVEGLTLEHRLTVDYPMVADFRLHSANARSLLDEILDWPSPPHGAEQDCLRAISVWTKLSTDFPTDIEYRDKLVRSHWRLGDLMQESGRHLEADSAYTKAVELTPGDSSIWLKRAAFLASRGEIEKAAGDYSKALELDPSSAVAHNNLAWLLATCPEAKLRDSLRAVEMAKKAIELAPLQGGHWNTLGVAQYRAGQWRAAIEALTKSMELRAGGDSFDSFFLAMAYWQLGNKDEAGTWYDRGVTWIEKNRALLDNDQQHNAELKRFRTEAEELLK